MTLEPTNGRAGMALSVFLALPAVSAAIGSNRNRETSLRAALRQAGLLSGGMVRDIDAAGRAFRSWQGSRALDLQDQPAPERSPAARRRRPAGGARALHRLLHSSGLGAGLPTGWSEPEEGL